jgi:hypothetical protein
MFLRFNELRSRFLERMVLLNPQETIGEQWKSLTYTIVIDGQQRSVGLRSSVCVRCVVFALGNTNQATARSTRRVATDGLELFENFRHVSRLCS